MFILITQYGSLISQYLGLSQQLYYFMTIMPKGIEYNALFNSFSVLVCLFLWINRKKLTRPDIFIATQYFLITILFIELPFYEPVVGWIQFCSYETAAPIYSNP